MIHKTTKSATKDVDNQLIIIYIVLVNNYCCILNFLQLFVLHQQKDGDQMKLSNQQVIALKRKRGEKNLTINNLANEIGVSRYTISRIIKNGSSENITSTTGKKVNDWLIDEYTTIS